MKSIWRLLKFVAPFKWWVLLATVLGFATVGSSVGLMATSAYIISKAARHPSIAVLQVSIVGVRFFGVARGGFRYLERYVSHQITFRLLAQLRVWFYNALEPLAPARLQQYRSGDLLARIVADIENLEHFYVRVIAPPVVAALSGGLMWILLSSFDTRLALTTVGFLLVAAVGIPLLTQTLSKGIGKAMVEVRAALNIALVDGVQGLADLLIFGKDGDHQRSIQRLSRTLIRLQNKNALVSGLNTALMSLLTNWAALAILLLAIPMIHSGKLDGVYLAVLVLATIASFEAISPLPETFQHLEGSLSAAQRLFEIVDVPPVVIDTPSPFPTPKGFGLKIEHLSFAYNVGDNPALTNISFSVPPQSRLAIVGPSGAGKSTLVNLLLRFWDYHQGEIWLGGHELRQYRLDDLRTMMSVVSQRTHLFTGTIRDNLRLAQPDASDETIIQAARQAQIHQFIQSLPQGYNTWVGEQGVRLSGGERQRLAIARALLKNAPILILDEPTSNLDPVVEREIMQTIHTLMAERTTLLITHRLTGMDAVDQILVLKNGRIVEAGKHHTLLAKQGLYHQLWTLQHQIDLLTSVR